MSNKWKSGPPPSFGWWPASSYQHHGVYRWWNGEHWSICARQGDNSGYVNFAAQTKTAMKGVYWTARPVSWPARSFT